MARARRRVVARIAGTLTVVGGVGAGVALASMVTTLYEGTWTKVYAEAKGTWKITGDEFMAQGRQLKLSAEFETQEASELLIYLSPKPLAELTDLNAIEGAQIVGELQSASGAQTFDIPDDVDFDEYASVIAYTTVLGKLWFGSDLEGEGGGGEGE